MTKIYVETIGLDIILDCKTAITGATSVKVVAQKPDGTVEEWSAAVFGTDKVKYTTVTGNLNMPGDFKVHPKFTLNGWTGHGDMAIVPVETLFN